MSNQGYFILFCVAIVSLVLIPTVGSIVVSLIDHYLKTRSGDKR